MDDRELTIKINTNVKYQKISINHICLFDYLFISS